MEQPTNKNKGWRNLIISIMAGVACICATTDDLYTPYVPPNERGPIVIMIPGRDGADNYRTYAEEIAQLGYYSVLLESPTSYAYKPPSEERKAVINPWSSDPKGNLRRVIEQAQGSPNAIPGKAAVIGFSMGGVGALAYAASMPDLVSAVVAFYPQTKNIADMRSFAAQFKVPILLLAGEKDTYMNCCLIESMRAMESAAKDGGKSFELVVYPNAGHAFIWKNPWSYKAEDARDAWQRAFKMLNQYHPPR